MAAEPGSESRPRGRVLAPSWGVPVLVLGGPMYVGPLGAMRSLGRLGIPVFGLRHEGPSLSMRSRYAAGAVAVGEGGRPHAGGDERTLDELQAAAARLGRGAILLAGSDEWAMFVDRHAEQLERIFTFAAPAPGLASLLADKSRAAELRARAPGQVPFTIAFREAVEADGATRRGLPYPLLAKPALSTPAAGSKTVIAGADDLAGFLARHRPADWVFQELIEGPVDNLMVNAYLDADGRPLLWGAARKLRQHPIGRGIATLAETVPFPPQGARVLDMLASLGYSGVVDVDLVRSGDTWSAVDFNPRLGGAFRAFVTPDGLDPVRALYSDLVGRPPQPAEVPAGRRWLQEAADAVARRRHHRQRGESRLRMARDLLRVDEGATFSLSDPAPFAVLAREFVRETVNGRAQPPPATGEALDVEIVRGLTAFGALEAEWRRLEAESATTNPFLAWEWTRTWLEHMSGDDVLTAVVRRAGAVVAIAPFHRNAYNVLPGLRAHALQLLAPREVAHLFEQREVLALPKDAAAATDALTDALLRLPGVDWVELSKQGRPAAHVEVVAGQRLHPLESTLVPRMQLPGSWEALRARLRRNVKESIRRSFNRLDRAGLGPSFKVVSEAGEATAAAQALVRLHAARAGMESGVPHADNFAEPARRRFLEAVSARMMAAGRLYYTQLWLDGRLGATRLVLRARGTAYLYYSGWEPDLGPYSVMTATLVEHLRHAIASGLTEVNLSPGLDQSKLRWDVSCEPLTTYAVTTSRRGRLLLRLLQGRKALGSVYRSALSWRPPAGRRR